MSLWIRKKTLRIRKLNGSAVRFKGKLLLSYYEKRLLNAIKRFEIITMVARMNVIDLFCGMGGLSYGFSREGFQVMGFDKSEHALLAFNFNRIGRGIRKDLLTSEVEFEEGDEDVIIIGGPPCEPWSRLNLRKRCFRHPLYNCIIHFFKTIFRINPVIFILENVPDLLKDSTVCKLLERAGSGFSLAHRVICYNHYGAATSRKRLFIIGIRHGYGLSAEDIFECIPRGEPRTVRDAIWDLRHVNWNERINHVWPSARTVRKYMRYYKSGKYGWYILEWDKPSPSFGNIAKTYILHPDSFNGGQTRPISVREALRIMGFPDSYRLPPEIPLNVKYEMIADAVSPVFSLKLARTVKKLLL